MITDEELVELIKRDLNRGFELLIREYQKRIYYVIRRMVNTHEETDDLIQEVFIKVYKNINKFKQDSSLYTWVYRIATNETINYLKKSSRMQIVELEGQTWIPDINNCDSTMIIRHLEQAIDKLPPKQKEIFKMRYYDELKYEEMSTLLGTSVGALKASYHHAAKKIELIIKGSNIY